MDKLENKDLDNTIIKYCNKWLEIPLYDSNAYTYKTKSLLSLNNYTEALKTAEEQIVAENCDYYGY